MAGSVGFTGAPVLAANAAVRAGAGLVYLGVPAEVWPVVAARCLEAMPHPLPESAREVTARVAACDAALIGPGLSREEGTAALVRSLVSDLTVPVVLDADGLNVFSGRTELLKARRAPLVLTPHEGEFARLTGCPLPVKDREAAARELAQALDCTVVLKGHGTLTAAAGGRVWRNTTGNPGMAKGGSGDVLAGIILALIAQGFPVPESAAMAVWLHGRAGDLAAEALGEYGMIPSDLLTYLPQALKELEE